MARYTRRRGGGNRRTRRKRGYGKTNRRSRTRTGLTIRRTGKTFRRRVAGGYKRWKKYYFSRMVDFEYKNIDPEIGSPAVQVASYSSPLPAIGNQVSPAVIDTTAPVADGCSNFGAAMIFKMNNLPNMTEFLSTGPPPAGLFEEYKLSKVCIEITPTYAGKDIISNTEFVGIPGVDDGYTYQRSYPTPKMYYITDYDSTNSINWPMICEMNGVNRLDLNRRHKIWVKPSTVIPIAGTLAGGSTWSSTKKSPWITNKDLTIQHYGLRFLMQDWPGPNDEVGPEGDQVPFSVRFNVRYYFTCRGSM